MKEYSIDTDDIVDIYKRYVMRNPTKKIKRYTGQVDEVSKPDWEIKNAAMVWWLHFKNRVQK